MGIFKFEIVKGENGWFYVMSDEDFFCTTKMSEIFEWIKLILGGDNSLMDLKDIADWSKEVFDEYK